MPAAKQKCPRCGASVNAENLRSHVARVHPRDGVHVPPPTSEGRGPDRIRRLPMSMSQRRRLAVGVAAVVFAALGIALWSALSVPVGGTIHLEPAEYDFGTIQAAGGPISTTFRLHNRGSSNLVLLGLSTSCMCTTARVAYGGQVSPTFGYHDNPGGWSMALPPEAEAYLEVFYDPNEHPELGYFQRAVYILSSDPAQREASVLISVYEV